MIDVVIGNSNVVGIGEMVKVRSGFAARVSAGDAVAGVVVDIVDVNENSIFGSTAVAGLATFTGTAANGSGVVTVGSTNQTVDKIAARICISKTKVYSGSLTGTINTTGTSATIGGWVNVVTNGQNIDETTHTRTIGQAGRVLKGFGTDQLDTTRMLVAINTSEIWDPNIVLA